MSKSTVSFLGDCLATVALAIMAADTPKLYVFLVEKQYTKQVIKKLRKLIRSFWELFSKVLIATTPREISRAKVEESQRLSVF